jgi:hypothetical protein
MEGQDITSRFGSAILFDLDPEALSNLSTDLNNPGRKKLHQPGWLISAIPVEFNHLARGQ